MPGCDLVWVQETGAHAVPGAQSQPILGSDSTFSNAVARCPFSAVSASWGSCAPPLHTFCPWLSP